MAEDKLTEAVRELIRQELQSPQETQAAVEPRISDAGWLLLTIADLVLLLSLVPARWFESPLAGVLEKLVPWLCSGLFLVGYTWFRDRLLIFTRTRYFKIALLSVFPLLLVSYTPVFAIRFMVEPAAGASLLVDGKPANPSGKIWLHLRSYEISVRSAQSGATGRDLEIGPSDLWRGIFGLFGNKVDCPLLWDVELMRSDQRSQLRIEGITDQTFLQNPSVGGSFSRDGESILFHFPEGGVLVHAKLPVGRYRIRAESPGCEPSSFRDVQVGPGSTLLQIEGLQCPH